MLQLERRRMASLCHSGADWVLERCGKHLLYPFQDVRPVEENHTMVRVEGMEAYQHSDVVPWRKSSSWTHFLLSKFEDYDALRREWMEVEGFFRVGIGTHTHTCGITLGNMQAMIFL